MRGSIQAPSYEEWSEAKKLAEGEDSDDVAVDEGRDVVGRPPTSLDISHNKLGQKTAAAFRRNFNDHDGQTGNRGLVNLKMRNCCLDDACFQFIAKGLRSTKSQAITHIDIGKNKMGAKGCDYIHETLQKRRNLTQRLRIVAKDQTGIKDLLIKDMIEDWWKKNEQERMNSKMTSAAESSMSSAD